MTTTPTRKASWFWVRASSRRRREPTSAATTSSRARARPRMTARQHWGDGGGFRPTTVPPASWERPPGLEREHRERLDRVCPPGRAPGTRRTTAVLLIEIGMPIKTAWEAGLPRASGKGDYARGRQRSAPRLRAPSTDPEALKRNSRPSAVRTPRRLRQELYLVGSTMSARPFDRPTPRLRTDQQGRADRAGRIEETQRWRP
jgi:hypothetical protein